MSYSAITTLTACSSTGFAPATCATIRNPMPQALLTAVTKHRMLSHSNRNTASIRMKFPTATTGGFASAPRTLFMRDVRARVKKHHKRLPIAVMVGHPWHYRGLMDPIDGNLRGLLLDVATWAEEGLMDAAIAAGYYRQGGDAAKAFQSL